MVLYHNVQKMYPHPHIPVLNYFDASTCHFGFVSVLSYNFAASKACCYLAKKLVENIICSFTDLYRSRWDVDGCAETLHPE